MAVKKTIAAETAPVETIMEPAMEAMAAMMKPETYTKAFAGNEMFEKAMAPVAGLQEQAREMTEKGMAQVKAQYDTFRKSAEGSTAAMEETFKVASTGANELNAKAIEAMKANMNAAFDLWSALLGVKSVAAAVELQTAHARKQFEAVTAQSKDMASLAQKVANDVQAPIKAAAATFKFSA
jgi:phasin